MPTADTPWSTMRVDAPKQEAPVGGPLCSEVENDLIRIDSIAQSIQDIQTRVAFLRFVKDLAKAFVSPHPPNGDDTRNEAGRIVSHLLVPENVKPYVQQLIDAKIVLSSKDEPGRVRLCTSELVRRLRAKHINEQVGAWQQH